jgi:DNA-directed RNA polymerase subunit N (RpoN/RPB10)
MYPFIVCFCGRSLGDIYDVFCLMRQAKYAEAYAAIDSAIDPALIPITESIQVELVDVFEQLNLHLSCCRTRIQAQVEFKTIY